METAWVCDRAWDVPGGAHWPSLAPAREYPGPDELGCAGGECAKPWPRQSWWLSLPSGISAVQSWIPVFLLFPEQFAGVTLPFPGATVNPGKSQCHQGMGALVNPLLHWDGDGAGSAVGI